jgi:hypothetical protein
VSPRPPMSPTPPGRSWSGPALGRHLVGFVPAGQPLRRVRGDVRTQVIRSTGPGSLECRMAPLHRNSGSQGGECLANQRVELVRRRDGRQHLASLTRVGDRPRRHLYVALGAPLHARGQLRVGAQIRAPGALARATAEKDPSVGVPDPDLDAAGSARFASVRGNVDNGMLIDGRVELSPWRCPSGAR